MLFSGGAAAGAAAGLGGGGFAGGAAAGLGGGGFAGGAAAGGGGAFFGRIGFTITTAYNISWS